MNKFMDDFMMTLIGTTILVGVPLYWLVSLAWGDDLPAPWDVVIPIVVGASVSALLGWGNRNQKENDDG